MHILVHLRPALKQRVRFFCSKICIMYILNMRRVVFKICGQKSTHFIHILAYFAKYWHILILLPVNMLPKYTYILGINTPNQRHSESINMLKCTILANSTILVHLCSQNDASLGYLYPNYRYILAAYLLVNTLNMLLLAYLL